MGSLSWCSVHRLTFLLLCLLLHPNASLSYSLKNCTVSYLEDASADVSVVCSSRDLIAVPDDIPTDAVSVDLFENRLQQINRDDFGVLSQLRVLVLRTNEITHVDDGAFIHMVLLTSLDMSINKLTVLTGRLFQGLLSLTVLDLTYNKIQAIHSSAFEPLSNLQTLILYSNKLRQIADILPILQLPHLRNLKIGGNPFFFFETKDLPLNASSDLEVLGLGFCRFEKLSITSQVFPNLKQIDLSLCHLNQVTLDRTLMRNITGLYFSQTFISFKEFQEILQSVDSLTALRLNGMEKYIHEGLLATVCQIPTLKSLDLSYNDVANLSAKLVTCSQLTELDFSMSDTFEVPKGSLRSMKQLRNLFLNSNSLTKVPDDVRSLSSLENLNLNINLISELGCEDFLNTTRLRKLYLNDNRIAKLYRCAFESLTDLKVLDMGHNLIWALGGAFEGSLQHLEFLDLSKNDISVLENNVFQGLRELRYLDMVSDNTVYVKHKAFDGLNNLRTLLVTLPYEFDNRFVGLQQLENLTIYLNLDLKSPQPKFSEGLAELKSLKNFTIICRESHPGLPFDVPAQLLQALKHLENFRAENIYGSAPDPKTFQFNPQLKSLTLSQTDLSEISPKLFQQVLNLQALDLSNSQLKSLDFLVQANLYVLRSLKLTDNAITVISEAVLQSLPALTYLDVSNNPFICDCSNAYFIQWAMSNNQTQVVNGHQYTCSFPAAEQGRKLLDFDLQSCRVDVSFFCFISSTCLVVLILFTSFIYHFLRWQLVYTFYLFLAFVYDSKRKKGAPQRYDAFVSYNVLDEAWVYREMLPVLEGEQGWRLCLHHRDFQPGKAIIENITDAIYGSRKTICVISRHYLQSEWCSREIQMASFRLFDEQKDVMVLLFLEDIPAHQLSPYYRMRKLLKRRTYLSWPQVSQHTGIFWQNVHRALESGEAPTDTTDPLTGATGL